MVLRMDVGETIEKYVLIKNVNDVPVNVEITPTGDLAEYVKLTETNLTLDVGEEEKAYFDSDYLIQRFLGLTPDQLAANESYKKKEAKAAPKAEGAEGEAAPAEGEEGEAPEVTL
jgi:hypothetical protein